MRIRFHKYSDYLGLTSAFVCLLHCLVAPLFLGVATHVHGPEGHIHEIPWYAHHAWDYVFLGIGFLAVRWSASHSHHLWIKRLLWVSLASLAGAILLEETSAIFSYLVYASSAALIVFHIWNLRSQLRNMNSRVVDVKVDPAESDTYLLNSPEKIAV